MAHEIEGGATEDADLGIPEATILAALDQLAGLEGSAADSPDIPTTEILAQWETTTDADAPEPQIQVHVEAVTCTETNAEAGPSTAAREAAPSRSPSEELIVVRYDAHKKEKGKEQDRVSRRRTLPNAGSEKIALPKKRRGLPPKIPTTPVQTDASEPSSKLAGRRRSRACDALVVVSPKPGTGDMWTTQTGRKRPGLSGDSVLEGEARTPAATPDSRRKVQKMILHSVEVPTSRKRSRRLPLAGSKEGIMRFLDDSSGPSVPSAIEPSGEVAQAAELAENATGMVAEEAVKVDEEVDEEASVDDFLSGL